MSKMQELWNEYRKGRTIKHTIKYVLYNVALMIIVLSILTRIFSIDYNALYEHNILGTLLLVALLLSINYLLFMIFDRENYTELSRKSW